VEVHFCRFAGTDPGSDDTFILLQEKASAHKERLTVVERSFYHLRMNLPIQDTRARLLAVTEQLVYAHGIAGTGMDRIVQESGVARKSIYRYFPDKEALVASALTERDARWMAWFAAAAPPALPLRARIDAMFHALAAWFDTPDFRGCAFINAAAETGDSGSVIRAVAKAHKLRLSSHLCQVLEDADVPHALADELAQQLLILIDGAITVALVTGDRGAAPRAARIAAALLPV
jgi:AcrR family transcriptional regulator